MEELIQTLRKKFRSSGSYQIFIELEGNMYSTMTTNMMAIDVAFDENYDDKDNSDRYYESQREAQESLIDEILRKNDIEL